MENKLQIFTNSEFGELRTVEIDREIYFVGKDVASILGYVNPRKALADHVDDEDKKDGVTIRDSIGREQTPIVINESGLYSLILSSKLPTAKKFKRWVTSEVLPSIRKHGIYATENFAEQAIKNPAWAIEILSAFKESQEKNRLLETQVAELTPKATYYDLVLQCPDLISITKIAKDYGYSGKAFNKLLNELGVQFNQSGIWLLYQKYAKLGWTSTKTYNYSDSKGNQHSSVTTHWTQKGRLGLYALLKDVGILPTIEQKEESDLSKLPKAYCVQ